MTISATEFFNRNLATEKQTPNSGPVRDPKHDSICRLFNDLNKEMKERESNKAANYEIEFLPGFPPIQNKPSTTNSVRQACGLFFQPSPTFRDLIKKVTAPIIPLTPIVGPITQKKTEEQAEIREKTIEQATDEILKYSSDPTIEKYTHIDNMLNQALADEIESINKRTAEEEFGDEEFETSTIIGRPNIVYDIVGELSDNVCDGLLGEIVIELNQIAEKKQQRIESRTTTDEILKPLLDDTVSALAAIREKRKKRQEAAEALQTGQQ